MFYIAEAANLPTASAPSPEPFFRAVERSERAARESLARAFERRGASAVVAEAFASDTESVWTDFGELGIAARVSFCA